MGKDLIGENGEEETGNRARSDGEVRMPGTYFDESLAAHVSSEARYHIRAINHSIGQVQRDAKGPLEAAIAYLRGHSSEFEIPEEQLTDPSGRASYHAPRQCPEQFRLLDERHVFDSHMFFFAHTYLNIPVWNAGVKIIVKDAPVRVVSAVNTSRAGIKTCLPGAGDISSFKRGFARELHDASVVTDDVSGAPSAAAQFDFLRNIIEKAIDGPTDGDLTTGLDCREPISRGRFYVYQYDESERLEKRVGTELEGLGGRLRAVSERINHGSWYVVAEITFPYTIVGKHDRANLRVLVEPETCSVLYLGSLAAEVGGYAFRLDPISMTGDKKLDWTRENCALNPLRRSVTLNNLDPPESGCQRLAGKYVKLVNVHLPDIPAPRQPSGCRFDYDVRTNHFSAVNAYFHTNQVFEVIESLGFPIDTYFKNTRFPIRVDHRGFSGKLKAHCVGDGRGGIGHVCYGLMDNGDAGPLGRACDPRVHWHELCGHGVLYEAVDSAGFHFAHSAGDGISGIFFDPESGVRDCPSLRFEYSPWHPEKHRRFDRDVACGWAWGGRHDDQEYESEEILSTCHFRVYQAIGGDSRYLGQRKFASRVMIYLILRAIHNLMPATNPRYAREFADELMTADRLNWTSDGMVGGAYNKVIRWSFEKQGEYQTPLVTRDDCRFGNVTTAGNPPSEDVYINDGRDGEYEFQEVFWNTTTIWNRKQADGRAEGGQCHQAPTADSRNYAYVKVKNRGTRSAHGVKVHGFHCRPSAGVSWPTGVRAMTTAMIDVGTVPDESSQEPIVGPFEWTPTTDGRGYDCMFMVVSSNQDASNISSLTHEESIPTWRLVPHDNNIVQRSVHVVPATSSQALLAALNGASLWVRNPGLTDASMRLDYRLPRVLASKCWRVAVSDLDEQPFVLAAGAEEEVKLSFTAGDDFDPCDIKSSDRDIVVRVLADDCVVGGMTYRLDPTLGAIPPARGRRRHGRNSGCFSGDRNASDQELSGQSAGS